MSRMRATQLIARWLGVIFTNFATAMGLSLGDSNADLIPMTATALAGAILLGADYGIRRIRKRIEAEEGVGAA